MKPTFSQPTAIDPEAFPCAVLEVACAVRDYAMGTYPASFTINDLRRAGRLPPVGDDKQIGAGFRLARKWRFIVRAKGQHFATSARTQRHGGLQAVWVASKDLMEGRLFQ